MNAPLVTISRRACALQLEINRAARSNALTDEVLVALSHALQQAETSDAKAVVLRGAGRHFSTGGDVARFESAVRTGQGAAYATRIVGLLHTVIDQIVGLPKPVIACAQGATTGGACGLIFCADLVVMWPDAFIQPWYSKVGFAPDGGWTALLPQLVGPRVALAALLSNRRISAEEALAMGLADSVSDAPDAVLDAWLAEIDQAPAGTLETAKKLVWSEARCTALRQGLAAETNAFVARIGLPEVATGMARFLGERV